MCLLQSIFRRYRKNCIYADHSRNGGGDTFFFFKKNNKLDGFKCVFKLNGGGGTFFGKSHMFFKSHVFDRFGEVT
jgi:hypothetical protein